MPAERTNPDPSLESSVENPRTARVRDLLRLLVKAQKAHRLYASKNAVSERIERELYDGLAAYLETEGEIALTVHEFQLKSGDDLAYESRDRKDSLAFSLYRDGVRRLSFHPGLEPSELEALISCLNRVALHGSDQDDLVTLFWEQDFRNIRYYAVEDLSTRQSFPRLEEQLASAEMTCEGAGEPGGVSLDLEQPVSSVPVDACRLDDDEIESLQAELAREAEAPLENLVVELAIELTLLEEDEGERRELITSLVAIGDRLIAEGALHELAAMVEHLEGLATMVFHEEAPIGALCRELFSQLAEPQRVDGFLEKVGDDHALRPEGLTAYVARLGVVPDALFPWMGRLPSSAYRRALTSAVLASRDGGLEATEANLPLAPAGESPAERVEHRQYVRECLHAISQQPGEIAVPLLNRLLDARDAETRRESFVTMSRYPDTEVEDLSLARLGDPDPEIRAAALDTLVRRGKSELGEKILDLSLSRERLDARSLNEKRRLFAAVAKLCGESLLDRLFQQLMAEEERWFTSKKEKEFAEAVAHGIRVVGTKRASELLHHGAENGARFVRAACEKELGH